MIAAGANAHVAEQGFVLLLPTDIYIAAGVATVALTVILLALTPPSLSERAFATVALPTPRFTRARRAGQVVIATVLAALLWIGWTGPFDPLANPLPLYVWTLWWIGLVAIQGLLGNIWSWLNPMAVPARLCADLGLPAANLRLPRALGRFPAVVLFMALVSFILADTAPSAPARLAGIIAAYWAFTTLGLWLFGPRWLVQVEVVTVLMRTYGRLGIFAGGPRGMRLGLWGFQLLRRGPPAAGTALLMLVLLGAGTFDGLNETFWWLARLGLNPLEFPGRSAVILPTLLGLFGSVAVLVAIFTLCIRLGVALAGGGLPLSRAFRAFAPAILPIALGYHIGHYFTSFLVDFQWAVAATSDPLDTGADLLNLGTFYVTTGFFNTPGTVRTIWLTQAGAVVIGHVVSILLAHAIALREFGDPKRALLSQAPLAAFMIAYTLLGLWLLASPRGV